MNLPEKKIQALIDRLTRCEVSFALYRLPWTDQCHLVLQTASDAEKLANLEELNGKRGFVMAPFSITPQHPPILIHPDVTATDWKEISQALTAFQEHVHVSIEEHSNEEVEIRTEEEKKAKYLEDFRDFMTPLGSQKFQKLVLSRSSEQLLSDTYSPLRTFVKACNLYPRMFIYLCHTPTTGTWIGSTPEILLSGHDKSWHTVALAGTMPFDEANMPPKWSKKNQEEQAFVADYIRRIVTRFDTKYSEKEPHTARAGGLVHLKSDFYFTLKNKEILGTVLQELHPTPAVCGIPKKEAFHFIQTQESHDRSYYSGIIGWLDPNAMTDLYVNLRCMKIKEKSAVLYAGGGILASSDFEAEWEETNQKLKTMQAAFNQPTCNQ
ncbi:MAG: isochorismate synthase [Phocaeicola sp.]